MNELRHRVARRARAIARENGHATVLPIHLLLALLEELGPSGPASPAIDDVRALLPPPGTATDAPSLDANATAILSEIGEGSSVAGLATRLGQMTGLPQPRERTAPAPGNAPRRRSRRRATDQAAESAGPDSETVDRIFAELEAMVGLDELKAELRRLVAIQEANRARRTRGLREVSPSNHLVFTGGAGTGKTTVARLVARLFGATGIVSRGHLVEATRADLVASYVGQTAPKVEEVVSRALGGVLFIDEAYTLALDAGRDTGFGSEAIATLVKLMEEHRADLVVIVAGYDAEMRDLIAANAGLRSRFNRYLRFPDYTPDQLVLILEGMAADHGVRLGPGVRDRARQTFVEAATNADFGNARYVRSLFEDAFGNMAARAAVDGRIEDHEIEEITLADLPVTALPATRSAGRIGFRPSAGGGA